MTYSTVCFMFPIVSYKSIYYDIFVIFEVPTHLQVFTVMLRHTK